MRLKAERAAAAAVPLGEPLSQMAVVEGVGRAVRDSKRDNRVVGNREMGAQESYRSRDVLMSAGTIVPSTESSDQRHVLWVQRVHPYAVLPSRSTPGSAGFDLYACEDGSVDPGPIPTKINIGIQIALPKNTFGHIVAKSGIRALIQVSASRE